MDPRAVRRELRARVWREHRAIILLVATYVIGSLALGRALGWYAPSAGLLGYVGSFLPTSAYAVIYLFIFRRQAERAGVTGVWAGWKAGWEEARRRAWSDERLAGALIVIALFPVFATIWTSWKVSIPAIVPFQWDATFAAWDRALLGGHDAWRLTHAVLGHPLLTRLVDVLYLPAWALEQSIVLPLAAIAPPGALRRRFLLTYLLSWIVAGNLLAVLYSSVGPCYLGIVAGTSADAAPFAPLMAKLRAMHADFLMTSVRGQRFLLAAWEGKIPRLAGGISAFPSMHVTAAVAVALYARRMSRRLGRLAVAFAVVVLVGSVHLGWHYLVDGLAGVAIALLLWWGVGLVVKDDGKATS